MTTTTVTSARPDRRAAATPATSAMQPSAPVTRRSHTEDPGYGRSIVFSTLIGAVTVLAMVGGGMVLGGASHADALGIGIFAAVWGGVGFGVMVGGVVQAQRLHLAVLPARVSPRSSTATPTASLSEWPSTTPVPAR